ncbi:hypothetical protein CTAYLR_003213 [Chrysophaeum taylorii]|uniref:Uncharacterized protein n=1 Tax=Chrysophaeum taylorii TaxID=2483200 RepID=A0AAD7UCD5_9STRA|nr:hypothetical protein CTAYLR_003213 [Chrysophaeum taylorii]
MALRRSFARLGEVKAGVQPHLELWWKKKPTTGVTDGMVTQQVISPFELTPVSSLLDNWSPAKLVDTFPSLWDIGPGIILLVGTVYGADWYFEYLAHSHRD